MFYKTGLELDSGEELGQRTDDVISRRSAPQGSSDSAILSHSEASSLSGLVG